MNLERQELRTGLLVVVTLAAFVGILIYLGSPGVFAGGGFLAIGGGDCAKFEAAVYGGVHERGHA